MLSLREETGIQVRLKHTVLTTCIFLSYFPTHFSMASETGCFFPFPFKIYKFEKFLLQIIKHVHAFLGLHLLSQKKQNGKYNHMEKTVITG